MCSFQLPDKNFMKEYTFKNKNKWSKEIGNYTQKFIYLKIKIRMKLLD